MKRRYSYLELANNSPVLVTGISCQWYHQSQCSGSGFHQSRCSGSEFIPLTSSVLIALLYCKKNTENLLDLEKCRELFFTFFYRILQNSGFPGHLAEGREGFYIPPIDRQIDRF